MANYCTNCGKENPEGARFCNYCGMQYGGRAEQCAPRAPVAVPQAAPVKPTPRGKRNPALSAVLGVSCSCLLLVVAFLVIVGNFPLDRGSSSGVSSEPVQSEETVRSPGRYAKELLENGPGDDVLAYLNRLELTARQVTDEELKSSLEEEIASIEPEVMQAREALARQQEAERQREAERQAALREALITQAYKDQDLLDEYDANKVTFSKKYDDTYIDVIGVVDDIGLDILDNPYVVFEDEDEWSWAQIQCYFPKDTDFARVSKGQTLVVRGEVSCTLGLSLRHCEIKVFDADE